MNTPIIDDKLLYRRQFFFSPHIIKNLPKWKKIKVTNDYFLTVHPDLEHIHLKKGDVEIIALGFILDPFNANHSNKVIVNNLINNSTGFKSVIKNTYNWGGRWIIIYKDNSDIRLFNDPGGSRQIFYSFHENSVWCASQPHTMAAQLNIEKSADPDLLDFINSKEFEDDEHCMVGDGTIYNDIFHLIPNHYLSINNKYVKRYWPNERIPNLTLPEATEKFSELFTKLYISANNRFKIMQPVTAGIETRLLLAASRKVSNNIFYFIHKFNKLTRLSSDIRTPKKLMKSIGLNFNVVNCNEYDNDFDYYLKKNVYMIQAKMKRFQHYNYFKYFQGYVIASGNISGMIRFPPYNSINQDHNEYDLAKYFNAKNKQYVISALRRWLNPNLKEIINKNNVYLKDLFYWEHKGANWTPMFQSELDIAIEEWNPFNCRNLIIYACSVRSDDIIDKERSELYKLTCEKLWPEILTIPIGPPDYFSFIYIRNHIKNLIYKTLFYLQLVPILKKIKNAFKK